jgi:hypothetical protein
MGRDDLRPTAATTTTTMTNNTSERRERERERVKARRETMGAHKGFRFWALAPVQSPFHTSSCSAGAATVCIFTWGIHTLKKHTYCQSEVAARTHQPAPHHPLDGWMPVMTRLWWMKNLNSE